MDGGDKRNAIPREAKALVCLDPAQAEGLQARLAELQRELCAELGSPDPGLVLALEPLDLEPPQVLAGVDARRAVAFLYSCMHGVLAYAPDLPDLVLTSTNLASVATEDDRIRVGLSHRSSLDSAKQDVGRMTAAYAELAGFDIEQGLGYPGWAPKLDSPLLGACRRVHRELFGREAEIKAVHAGLECGIIGEKYPDMDMISFGPTIEGAHSPDERLHIPSTAQFWRYLLELLARL
jgi:dipeptidase D